MPENLQNHYLRPQIKKRYSALVMLILIIMLCAALRPEIYNCIIYRGSIYNADRGELTTWSSNQNNTTKSIPEGFYLADYLPRITKNQTLEFNRTLNCIDFKT
ncbi:MAG: hypothetical protein NTV15_00660, partial [Candidatus Bathyarchaeota archaeon]|nr:hypothetical protein [Candidatus Bathyarchaeota archaeon]